MPGVADSGTSADEGGRSAPTRWLLFAVKLLLILNLLDLTTSLPNANNFNVGVRSQGALLVQVLLVFPLFFWAYRAIPPALRTLWSAPIPRAARAVILGVLAVQDHPHLLPDRAVSLDGCRHVHVPAP